MRANRGSQIENRQVRLTEREQTGQGVNTGSQRDNIQVRCEYRLTEQGQIGQG
jgi:hypothetical protein